MFHTVERWYENGASFNLEEWEKMKTLAKEAYGELEWEDSGYGEYGQFSFVKPNTENKG